MNKAKLSTKLANALNYYHKDVNKRCIKGDQCRYSGKTLGIKTKGCMIGQMLPSKTRVYLDEYYKNSRISTIISNEPVKFPKFMVDNTGLMGSMQSLHDTNNNWCETGLSGLGIENLERICGMYELDFNEFKRVIGFC